MRHSLIAQLGQPSSCDSRSSNTTQVCKCGDSVGQLVECDPVTLNVSLLMGNCMTYDIETEMAYLAACPFKPLHKLDSYLPLPQNVSKLNEFVCSPFNRQGLVCSECKPGYGPSVYTYNLQCSNVLAYTTVGHSTFSSNFFQ